MSDASLKASLACIEKSLPPGEGKRFRKATANITARVIFESSLGGLDATKAALQSRVDKKTAAEVIADGEAIRAAMDKAKSETEAKP